MAGRVYQLATIVNNAEAVAMIATNDPVGALQIDRFQLEATAVDGVILLTAPEEDLMRRRYLKTGKLRNTAHCLGKHAMMIRRDGVKISEA